MALLKFTILVALLATTSSTFSESTLRSAPQATAAAAVQRIELGKQLSGQIAKNSAPLIAMSPTAEIRVTNHVKYRFMPSAPAEYIVTAHSDAGSLAVAIVQNGVLKRVATPKQSRRATQWLQFQADPDDSIDIVIGTAVAAEAVPYSISVVDASMTPPTPHVPQAVPVSVGMQNAVSGLDRATPFNTVPARWLSIQIPRESRDWYTVRASSSDFDPALVMLDGKNQVVASRDDASTTDRSAVYTFKAGDAPAYVVLMPADDIATKDPSTIKYELTISKSQFDPNQPITSRIEYFLGGPIGAFIVGLLTSAALSYYFYVRSVRTKELHWELLSDEVFVDESTAASGLSMSVNGLEIKEASRLRVRLTARGPHQISSSLIASPLTLELRNATAILALSSRCSESSHWKVGAIAGEPKIRIDFDRLNPNDSIDLDVMYAQASDQLTAPAQVVLAGSLAEVSIHKDHDRPATVATRIATVAINLLFMVLTPVLLLDIKFNFMPRWWANFWVDYAPWMLVIVSFYLFATAEGRRIITLMLRYLVSLLPWRRGRR